MNFVPMKNLFTPPRRFDPSVPELMDRPDAEPELVKEALRELRAVNKYFGGLAAVQKNIIPLFQKLSPDKELSILDLATGAGDQPVAVASLARKLNRKVRITAVDRNPIMVEEARSLASSFPEISVLQADILNLPFAEKSFDIVLCSLVIHHFSDDDAIRLLQTMTRLSRVGFIVNDLNRSWIAAMVIWLYMHGTTRNPLMLFDSHTSVLRAFTAKELSGLAKKAGVGRFSVRTSLFFRLILKAETV